MMKSTRGKILFLIVVLWLMLFGITKLYDFVLLQNKNSKAAYVSENNVDADILLLGPCQVLWMAQPEVIEKETHLKTYNLGLTHADFAENYLLLYLYLKNNKIPQCLFLYVSPESMDINYNTFNTYRFAPFMNDEKVKEVVKECDPSYFKWSSFPFMKYAYYSNAIHFDAVQGMKHFLTKKSTPYFADGFEPPLSIQKQQYTSDFIQIYPKGYSFEWDKLREKYLREIIVLAQQKGINVFLYESPLLKQALENLANRKEMMNKLTLLADNYRVDFIPFDSMTISDSAEYFLSSVITNVEGGRIFSDSLAKRIKDKIAL